MLYIPRRLYLYLKGAQTIPDVAENLRKGIALGSLDTFSSNPRIVKDDRKPTVPFMAMKENRIQSTAEDTFRAMTESIQESMYENNKALVKLLDKIGDKLQNVVEDFQRKLSSRDRDRYRSNSRDRDHSRDNYRDRDRRDSKDYNRNRSRNDSRDRHRDRSNSRNERDRRRNKQRSGTSYKCTDKNEFCNYCDKTGHTTHRCYRLEDYLKGKGKKIILHEEEDDQELAQAVQDLNTKRYSC